MHFSDVEVGKRLFVGNGQPKALKTGQDEVRGSAYIEGPLQTGTADAFGSIIATQMIARDKNEESDDVTDVEFEEVKEDEKQEDKK